MRALAAALLGQYPRIDVLANNAGGLVHRRGRSADGHERTIQHNHLAPFLLTNLLLPRLESSSARVIATASYANRWAQLDLDDLDFDHRPWLGGWRAYGTAKLANDPVHRASSPGARASPHTLSTLATFRRGSAQDTKLLKLAQFVGRGHLGRTAEQGAAPLVHLATVETVPAPSGTYFDGLKPGGRVHRAATDPALAKALWERTAGLVALSPS